MFTGLILICHLDTCQLVLGNTFFDTLQECEHSLYNEGVDYIKEYHPSTDYAEFDCHQWERKSGDPI